MSGPSRTKFVGSYEHQIDDKGRVSLPASFRREAADQRFILAQPYPPALALYPEVEWAIADERLAELVARNPEARMWRLSLLRNVLEVNPDGQGRILIPTKYREAAGLSSSVLMVGATTNIELWDPATFDRAAEGAQRFDQFTSQVFP
ncbi:MAG: division/cell wall cluster transcriptional repressor MraZ [Gemmatimonadetes bacterium]|nr:division/cell wall cluster transcriptional repressor MraZ [Gemmatimonadota bacterium]